MQDAGRLPLGELSAEARELLAALLDTYKPLPTRAARPKDWRGLAAFADIPATRYDSILASSTPTMKVLELWTSKDKTATVSQLQECLQSMERYDVCEDADPLFERDAQLYFKRLNKPAPCVEYSLDNRITYDDVLLHPQVQKYHVFVLYAEEDRVFAKELMDRLKNEGFKVCSVDDLLVGLATVHGAITQLIWERCQHIILIYSPDFFTSPENNFYMNFAQSIHIETNKRKIIPCMYKQCTLPFNYRFYHTIYYSPERRRAFNFWQKLINSIELNSELPRIPVPIVPAITAAPVTVPALTVPAVSLTVPAVTAPPETINQTAHEPPTINGHIEPITTHVQPTDNLSLKAHSNKKPKSFLKKVFNMKSKKNKSKVVLEAIAL